MRNYWWAPPPPLASNPELFAITAQMRLILYMCNHHVVPSYCAKCQLSRSPLKL